MGLPLASRVGWSGGRARRLYPDRARRGRSGRRRTDRRAARTCLDHDLGQVLVADADAALLLEVVDEGVHGLRAQIPEQPLLDLALGLGHRAVEPGALLGETDDRPPLVGLDQWREVADLLEVERRLDDRLGNGRA